MSKRWGVLLLVNAVLLLCAVAGFIVNFSGTSLAQRPPQANEDGVPFLKVNINPTNIPPGVDINPNRTVPKVDVVRMPPITFASAGCQNARNFLTEIGTSIAGPIVVTYINLSDKGTMTLADDRGQGGSIQISTPAITTAIYLRAGQQLQFENAVLWSGCRPE